jgi:hypothetical protein
MSKWTYDPTESINLGDKNFHLTPDRKEFIQALKEKYPNQLQFSKEQFNSLGHFPYWLKSNRYNFKDGSVFNLTPILAIDSNGTTVAVSKPEPLTVPKVAPQVQQMPVAAATASVNMIDDNVKIIPEKMPNYVPFGHAKDVKNIIKSKMFFPFFVTGLSGNGKTLMIEQTCAQLNRELFRVNITIETDEDDLMGGHTLQNGNIIFREGPVIKAMRKGAVLLLDEVDLGSNKMMCLQSVLEGKGYLIKKTGEWVTPTPGFTVVATANTKGQGSEDGKFIGTQIMNEAMLERFAITMQQEYPPVTTERNILKQEMALTGDVDEDFVKKLVDWADIIRKTYYEGAIDDVITTRRLVHIVSAYKMFGDKLKAITMCISRFDEETRNAVLDLYTKVDDGVHLENSIDDSESSEYND